MSLESPWDYYLVLQTQLRDSTIVDDFSWGLEAALNRSVASDAPPPIVEVTRASQSEGRRERYRANLRRHRLSRDELCIDGEAVLQAREQLRMVEECVTEEELKLLARVGDGHAYSEIAEATNSSPGGLRVRVARLRRWISAVLAA